MKELHLQVSKIKASEKIGVRYMQEWEERAYWKEEGLKVLIETCKELGLTKEEIFAKVKDKFSFTEEESRRYFEDYWQD